MLVLERAQENSIYPRPPGSEQLGDRQEERGLWSQKHPLHDRAPTFSVSAADANDSLPIVSPRSRHTFLSGLRKAGFPALRKDMARLLIPVPQSVKTHRPLGKGQGVRESRRVIPGALPLGGRNGGRKTGPQRPPSSGNTKSCPRFGVVTLGGSHAQPCSTPSSGSSTVPGY